MKRILVVGSSGFVGKNLFNRLSKSFETYGVSTRNSPTTTNVGNMSSKESIEMILSRISPDIIIQTAKARGGVDFYELNEQKVREIEINGARNITDWAKANSRKLVLISTDYVYAGERNEYNEESETKPVCKYGRIKLDVEQIVREYSDNLILRPTVIFGYDPNGTNFLMQILETKAQRKIPKDQFSNPTDVSILVDYIEGLIKRDAKGTFVATGPETLSRLEFTYLISEVFNIDKNLFKGVGTEELGQLAKRPLNNGTNSSKIRNYLNYNPHSILESLLNIKESIK